MRRSISVFMLIPSTAERQPLLQAIESLIAPQRLIANGSIGTACSTSNKSNHDHLNTRPSHLPLRTPRRIRCKPLLHGPHDARARGPPLPPRHLLRRNNHPLNNPDAMDVRLPALTNLPPQQFPSQILRPCQRRPGNPRHRALAPGLPQPRRPGRQRPTLASRSPSTLDLSNHGALRVRAGCFLRMAVLAWRVWAEGFSIVDRNRNDRRTRGGSWMGSVRASSAVSTYISCERELTLALGSQRQIAWSRQAGRGRRDSSR